MAWFLDTRSQKLQHLQKRLFGRLVNFQVAHNPQTECAFQKVRCRYDFNTKLCRKQQKVLQNDAMDKICNTEWGKTRNIKSLNLAAVKHMTIQVTNPPLQQKMRHNPMHKAGNDRGPVYYGYSM